MMRRGMLSLVLGACIMMMTSGFTTQEKKKTMEYTIAVNRGAEKLGTIVLRLWPDVAPKHAAHFDARVREGFYNGSAFHRVIPGFVIQGGDPTSKKSDRMLWGTGGHSEKVPLEVSDRKHLRGVLSAARRTNDPNSYSGQFFICVAATPSLDNQYTAFGEVLSGMEVVDTIVNSPRDQRDNPIEPITMTIEPKE